MSYDYTTYDPATGRILRVGTTDALAWAMEQAEHVVDGDPCILLGEQGDRETEMIDVAARARVPRPTIPDLATVPPGTQVFVDGADHGICDDGTVEIASDVPGTYRVRLEPPFPHQPFETDVTIP